MSKGYAFGLNKESIDVAIARFTNGKEHYEISIDADKAIAYKQGKIDDIHEVVHSDDIFTDVKKGLRPTLADLERVFHTTDHHAIMDHIIKHGMIQVSEAFREQKREELRRKIIALVHRNAVDPKTNIPHPLTRVEAALEQAKVKIDEHKSAEDQVADIVKKLQPILPLKFETKELWIEVTHKYASTALLMIKQQTTVLTQSFDKEGTLTCTVEIPGGMQEEFFDKLNNLTHGEAVTKLLRIK